MKCFNISLLSASWRTSTLFTSLTCAINLNWPVVFLIVTNKNWNVIGLNYHFSISGRFLVFVIADNKIQEYTNSNNFHKLPIHCHRQGKKVKKYAMIPTIPVSTFVFCFIKRTSMSTNYPCITTDKARR